MVINMKKISVITVCLNTEDTIAETIESVLCQTYENVEYIIMDGCSTDKTLEIIRRYEEQPKMRVFSGKDSGLYNAMNKGIDINSGDYILFLNSGDVFADKEALSKVMAEIEITDTKEPELIYGNVIRTYADGCKLEKYPGRHIVFKLLMMGRMPCHQSMLTRADIMRKYRFDESYKICADFDFLTRCLREHVQMQYVDVTVSKVDSVEGISSQAANLNLMRAEDDRSIRENYPLMYYAMWLPKKIIRHGKDKK